MVQFFVIYFYIKTVDSYIDLDQTLPAFVYADVMTPPATQASLCGHLLCKIKNEPVD